MPTEIKKEDLKSHIGQQIKICLGDKQKTVLLVDVLKETIVYNNNIYCDISGDKLKFYAN